MSRTRRGLVAALGACALALLSAVPLALAAGPPDPVTISVDEAIVVSDAPRVLPPAVIAITEGIAVSDTPTVSITVIPPGGDGGGSGPPGATPELDSLLLFSSGLSGAAVYALARLRARGRS